MTRISDKLLVALSVRRSYSALESPTASATSMPAKKHYIFMQGTDIKFTEIPTKEEEDRSYIRGETWSYLAQLTSYCLNEHPSIIDKLAPDHHAYQSPSVDLINGPDTIGSAVGHRIATGLMLALTALAEGKQQLMISGFSRGAVEVIMLTHELQRIKNRLERANDDESLREILINTSAVKNFFGTSTVRIALEQLIPENFSSSSDKPTMIENLREAFLHMKPANVFLLDPVPGGRPKGAPGTGWHEPEFYTLPDIVDKTRSKVLVAEHETTNCFRPVILNDVPYEVIPGCHGTGDGNMFADDGTEVPNHIAERDLRGVQNLVLCQWLDIAELPPLRAEQIKLINSFEEDSQQLTATLPLTESALDYDIIPLPNLIISNLHEHNELNTIVFRYLLEQNKQNKDVMLLEIYADISKNYPAFEFLSTRTYPLLGRIGHQRMVNYKQHNHTSITQLNTHKNGSFINLEHSQLWIKIVLNAQENTQISGQITWLTDILAQVIHALNCTPQTSTKEQKDLLRLFNDSEHNNNFMGALHVFVGSIAQKYLRNHLTEDEKKEIISLIKNLLSTLQNIFPSSEIIHEAESAQKTFIDSIKVTVQEACLAYKNALDSQITRMYDQSLVNELARDVPSWLSETSILWQQIQTLPEYLNPLEELCIEFDENHLHKEEQYRTKLNDYLRLAGGRVLYTQPIHANLLPELDPNFLEMIQKQAVAFGVPSREMIDLRKNIEQLSNENATLLNMIEAQARATAEEAQAALENEAEKNNLSPVSSNLLFQTFRTYPKLMSLSLILLTTALACAIVLAAIYLKPSTLLDFIPLIAKISIPTVFAVSGASILAGSLFNTNKKAPAVQSPPNQQELSP